MSRNTTARTPIDSGGRITGSRRILVSINDQQRDHDSIGSYAGWGSGEDGPQPEKEPVIPTVPGLMPFLKYRSTDRAWRVGFGLLWIPAIIIALTIEQWLNVPQTFQWISLGVLFVVFIGVALFSDLLLR